MTKQSYKDIRDAVGTDPLWYDENGTPRYAPFEPRMTADYGHEVILMEIACQNCQERFDVAMTSDAWDFWDEDELPSLRESVLDGTVHYGDPPNIGCCPAGYTMNSVPIRIKEFWVLGEDGFDYNRAQHLEIELHPDWMEDDDV